MSDESPPPYSSVIANPSLHLPVSEFQDSTATLPFSHSDRFATEIQALVLVGTMLDSRFKDVRDIASAGAEFEYQEHALVLSQRFESLVWESRNIAGIAYVAVKDFNEIVLDFLSEPDVVVQDRIKELVNSSKLLQLGRDSVSNQKVSFDTLSKELRDFQEMIHTESGTLIPKRRRHSHSGGRGTKSTRTPRPPFIIPRSDPASALSMVVASFGTVSQTCLNYALQFERMAECAVFPFCVATSPPGLPAQGTDSGAAPSKPLERKRPWPSVERSGSVALPSLVNTLVLDLCRFASRLDVFGNVFAELARAQDIFILYLKDGQSIANQGYRSEINRLRGRLPCVCNALDAYSKARLL